VHVMYARSSQCCGPDFIILPLVNRSILSMHVQDPLLEDVSDPFYGEPKTGKSYQFLRLSTKENRNNNQQRVLLSSALFYANQRMH